MSQMNTDQGAEWARLVGGFLMNCGAMEVVLFNWIDQLSTDKIVRDIAIDLPLSKRLPLVCTLIKRSTMPEEQKKRALELWGEVAKVSKIRNIIAHSPFITHQASGQSGFIDVKKLKGSNGPVPIVPVSFADIANAGRMLAKIMPEIIEVFRRKPV